jgi:hypothetical protein
MSYVLLFADPTQVGTTTSAGVTAHVSMCAAGQPAILLSLLVDLQ